MAEEYKQTKRQNIEQERGRVAWQNVIEIKSSQAATLKKEYRSLARGLNAMIQINGLGQALGFLKAKGKNDQNKAHYKLLGHLSVWMEGTDSNGKEHFAARNRDGVMEGYDGLLKWVTDAGTSSADYRRATTECLAFGQWLSRFAEAELEEEDKPKQGGKNDV